MKLFYKKHFKAKGFSLTEMSISILVISVVTIMIIKGGDLRNKINDVGNKWATQGLSPGLEPCSDIKINSTSISGYFTNIINSSCLAVFTYDSEEDNGSGQTEYNVQFLQDVKADIIIVAGGGSGGLIATSWEPGGGGAGGLIFENDYSISKGSYNIRVGNGGANSNGKDSEFGNLFTAIGGGMGGNSSGSSSGNGNSGGSGGGGGFRRVGGSGISGQGNSGGSTNNPVSNNGGGGGGSGTSGSIYLGGVGLAEKNGIDFKENFALSPEMNIGHYIAGADKIYFSGGGNAAKSPLSGTNTYGGGGRSRVANSFGSGFSAIPNTGGGGGAPYRNGIPGSGGSGVIILIYEKL